MPLIAGEAAGTRKRTGLGTKMTTTRKLTSITTAVALAATALGSMATAASAEGWRDGRRGGSDYSYSRSDRRDWDGDRHNGSRHRHGHRHHKDHTGKYIALGLGALMLGIIASEAGRH